MAKQSDSLCRLIALVAWLATQNENNLKRHELSLVGDSMFHMNLVFVTHTCCHAPTLCVGVERAAPNVCSASLDSYQAGIERVLK